MEHEEALVRPHLPVVPRRRLLLHPCPVTEAREEGGREEGDLKAGPLLELLGVGEGDAVDALERLRLRLPLPEGRAVLRARKGFHLATIIDHDHDGRKARGRVLCRCGERGGRGRGR